MHIKLRILRAQAQPHLSCYAQRVLGIGERPDGDARTRHVKFKVQDSLSVHNTLGSHLCFPPAKTLQWMDTTISKGLVSF
jgi:hypothetical protein